VLPTAVGVDIACGVCAVRTNLTFHPKKTGAAFWEKWAERVRARVPTGFAAHTDRQRWDGFRYEFRTQELQPLMRAKAEQQLGTLGGGNHFMEAQADEEDRVWLMVHSGSRHIGLRIAEFYTKHAEAMSRLLGEEVPKDLASLPLDDQAGRDYLADMEWATEYALESRYRMLEAMLDALRIDADELGGRAGFINIHHNFARIERHGERDVVIHRKGATSARANEIGLIPGSMGAPSYVVRGLGNPESFASCSHGAGRRMGRNQAKRTIDEAGLKRALSGTFTRPSLGFVDEAPQAYKDVTKVIAQQSDLVSIVHTLRPLITVKGDSKAKDD
jgi:tRNA-splicing ligase RtcB